MTYFQNVFTAEFRGTLALDDRQYNPNFNCPGNAGREDRAVITWQNGPYDLSGNDTEGDACANLAFRFAMDKEFTCWTDFSVDITDGAASTSAVTAVEIVAALNADATFASWFFAKTINSHTGVRIEALAKVPSIKFYIVNGQAEEKMKFNLRAGVAELPTYFLRHDIYDTHLQSLIALNPANDVDAAVINGAVDGKTGKSLGYSSASVQADWQLLKGCSGLFMFTKNTVDGSNRVTLSIEYPAGAVAGDFAKKTIYAYTSSNTNPDKKVEIPYVLTSGDLVTP